MILLNDESITHVPLNGTTPSSIDLALRTSEIYHYYTEKTALHMYTSDYFPCVLEKQINNTHLVNENSFNFHK